MSPEHSEGAPLQEAPLATSVRHDDDQIITDTASEVPIQLRRRRAASRRLAVLDSGLSDPWTDVGNLLPLPSNLEARRKTWLHLNDLGLVDDEGWITALLTDAGGATW